MNKTVNINISGLVFHIEEDAYDALQKYMHEIKLYFSRSAEDTEVVTDIENRIAEMFSELLKEGSREVIVLGDVETIIAQIGRVSDFQESAEDAGEGAPADTASEAAGAEAPRRLFRDPDDKKLGGVCAGISHYFDWDPVWLRVITALLTIFTSGIVAVVYIILWMVMPPARTLADKMAMKGQRFHLSNFRKSFDEEMSGVKATFNQLKNDVSNPGNATSFKKLMNELIDLLVRLIRGIGKVLLPIIAVILIAMGAIWLISTVVSIVGLSGFYRSDLAGGFPLNIVEPQYQTGFIVSAIAVIAIPAIALLLLGVRLLLKTNTMNTHIGLGMLAAWIIALGFTVFYSTSTFTDFQQGASVRQVIEFEPAGQTTWYLQLDEYPIANHGAPGLSSEGFGSSGISERSSAPIHNFSYTHRFAPWRNYSRDLDDWAELQEDIYEVDLRIEQSITGNAALVQVLNSRGENFNTAVENAEKIRYGFDRKDSVLHFNRYFTLTPGALWRAQKVDLTLQLPANSTLIIDKKLRRILENHELYSYDFGKVSKWVVTSEGLKPFETIDTAAAQLP
ncbi:MAG: PspC domain-containing protein [Solitalea sp.]